MAGNNGSRALEFSYRFNNREEEDLWAPVISALVIGTALPYAELLQRLEGEMRTGRKRNWTECRSSR